jgi:hypothetical protein
VIIDEIQRAPGLLITIKKMGDENRLPGRFILTGSADIRTFPKISERLAGRMEIIPLLPLSQAEIRNTFPTFPEMAFEGSPPPVPLMGKELVRSVLKGGYPEMLRRPDPERRKAWARDDFVSFFRLFFEPR